jgi:hypothetical protein
MVMMMIFAMGDHMIVNDLCQVFRTPNSYIDRDYQNSQLYNYFEDRSLSVWLEGEEVQ